jgi:hypothetical protein
MKNRPAESNRIELEKEDVGVGFVVGLVLALLVAGIPVAEATDATLSFKSGEIPQGHIHHYPAAQGHIHYTKPNAVQKPNGRHRPAPPVIVIPQPIYFAAPQRCVVPGYWNYSWVPQSDVSYEWVPGYYNYDAAWIEAHYEPRTYAWGYYQPYWVPERTC